MENGPPKSNQISYSTGGKCGGTIKFHHVLFLIYYVYENV